MTEIPQVKLSHNLCDAHLNVNNAGDVMESPETLWNHPDYIFTNRRENRMTQEQLMVLLNDMSLDEKINQLF